MGSSEYKFAEVSVDPVIMEQFSLEMSPYYGKGISGAQSSRRSSYHRKLMWHVRNSLSERQKQTLILILSGKTEREAATILGITQQVVHIYKWRAIKRLQEKLSV